MKQFDVLVRRGGVEVANSIAQLNANHNGLLRCQLSILFEFLRKRGAVHLRIACCMSHEPHSCHIREARMRGEGENEGKDREEEGE